ncbi:MAG TPA: hypothetical protein VL093_08950 [Flavipsychrobacter sp.]|nr:hypothetical protein [Flavipsychrobacter sp.]
MKAPKLLLTIATLSLAASVATAQKIKLKDGKLDALKGTTEFNVKYDYSNMTVTTKNKPEAEFITTKREDLNKKEPGTGDKWAESWVADREKRFAVQFKEEFEKQSDMKIGDNPEAKYTLVFHTTHTETGYNIGISRRNAYIDGELLVVETANPDNVIARISIDNAPGQTVGGYDFDTGVRLQESYAKAGKELGKFLRKKLK